MVEQFHRQLKVALRATEDPARWAVRLLLVLLGVHTACRCDLDCTVVDLVYGTSLRLPGQFFSAHSLGPPHDPAEFASLLRGVLEDPHPVPPRDISS